MLLNKYKNQVDSAPGNHGNDGKFHKTHQILNQTKRYINKLCLGKVSSSKTVRIKFTVDSGFSNKPYDKKRKCRKSTQSFLQEASIVSGVPLLDDFHCLH